MIEHRYHDEDVEAWIMPDIAAISYGRKVGYEVREARTSRPRCSRCLRPGSERCKGNVSERVHEFMVSEGIWED